MIKFYFILFLALLAGCTCSIESKISSWELEKNTCRISEIIKVSDFQPFYGHDSLLIIQNRYDSEFKQKLVQIAMQLDSSQNEYDKAKEEFSKIENPLMKSAYKLGLNKLEYKYHQHQKIDSIYRNHPEQTQFGYLLRQIDYYKQNKDKVLGFLVEAHFVGQQGRLPQKTYGKKYFIDVAKDEILNGWSIENNTNTIVN